MKAVRIVFILLVLSALALVWAETKFTMTVRGGKSDVHTYTQRLQAAMAQSSDIGRQFIHLPTDYDQKVQTMVAGGTPPDIMIFAEQIDVYASKGRLLPLDEQLVESGVNLAERYDAVLLEQYRNDGQLYARPSSWAFRAAALLSKGDL